VLSEPVIVGPTAGYLFSYPVAAFLVGFLAEREWDRRFWRAVAAMMLGEVAIYAIGLPWLALYVGTARALPLGLLPFIPGDTFKLLLAAAVLPSGWRFLTAIGRVRPGIHSTDR
jgi:biotin transporter BioY